MQFPTVQDAANLPYPAVSWLWTMDIMLGNSIIIDHMRVIEVNFPFQYIEIEGRYRAGSYIFFPGKNNIDQVTVSFYESEDFSILQAFKYWQSIIIDDNGNHTLPTNYFGSVVLYNYDNQGKPRLQCNLSGCWPARLSDWSLSYQGSNHLQVQVQFSVNNSNFSFFGANGSIITPGLSASSTNGLLQTIPQAVSANPSLAI